MLDVRTVSRAFPRITTTEATANDGGDDDDAVAYIITLVRRSVCSICDYRYTYGHVHRNV